MKVRCAALRYLVQVRQNIQSWNVLNSHKWEILDYIV